ncbi:MAG TPA: bifunctional glutamate N-acetyltransferase/amino-acid acetyltransferase ArgJ [Xanthobacteraceae bacterium]|jgi:glutamate N-acetyltransferase/amino-acid N-acetyltransferase
MGNVSPLAPASIAELPPIAGVRLATASAGIRYEGRTDVLLAVLDKGTAVAGVLTRSKCPSAPVEWCKARLGTGRARALVANAGNANAFTGEKGLAAVKRTAALAAEAVGCKSNEVLIASTGVIGEPLDASTIGRVLRGAALAARPENWKAAARAIMTTDTFAKLSSATARLGQTDVRINGIAKGSGMIAPDMATMLSFVFTDAPIAAPVLRTLVRQEVVDTFNAITVDGDTSTSDTLLVFATGGAAARGAPAIRSRGDKRLEEFRRALRAVFADLSEQIARDGEGARKLVRVTVKGAVSKASARKIALSIANSPLVKTAIAGEDANWGRVVMAVGKAGEPADRDKLSIYFGDIRVASAGARDPDYDEKKVSVYMKRDVIDLTVDLRLGRASDRVLTCDLTKEYVAINGDYRS